MTRRNIRSERTEPCLTPPLIWRQRHLYNLTLDVGIEYQCLIRRQVFPTIPSLAGWLVNLDIPLYQKQRQCHRSMSTQSHLHEHILEVDSWQEKIASAPFWNTVWVSCGMLHSERTGRNLSRAQISHNASQCDTPVTSLEKSRSLALTLKTGIIIWKWFWVIDEDVTKLYPK